MNKYPRDPVPSSQDAPEKRGSGTTVADRIQAEVVRLHELGLGRNETALQIGCRPADVTIAAKQAGIVYDRARTARAIHASRVDTQHRLAQQANVAAKVSRKAIDLMLAKLEAGTLEIASARDFREISVGFGVTAEKSMQLLGVEPAPDIEAPFEQLFNDINDHLENGNVDQQRTHDQ